MFKVRSTLSPEKCVIIPNISGYLRMDTNANLLGHNPVIKKVLSNIDEYGLNHYPSADSDLLRSELAKFYKLKTENFVVGNGSDELIDIILKTYTEHGDIITYPVPSFVMYRFFCDVNYLKVQEIPLIENFLLDIRTILNKAQNLIILASPNNPTGNCFNNIAELLDDKNRLIVVDEAYAEYSNQNFISLVKKYENLIVLRTFSKAYGLAGLRIGYLVANENRVRELFCAKPPFNLNTFSEIVAVESLKDTRFMEKSVQTIREERNYLAENLTKLNLKVYPSEANFLFVDAGNNAERIYKHLKARKILIKDFGKGKFSTFLRITIGSHEQNVNLVEILKELVLNRKN